MSQCVALSLELVIVALGIVVGFQITEWGERQVFRELAAENLDRAIAEAEYNAELLDKTVERLERESVLFESTLNGLIECNDDLTRSEIEAFIRLTTYDFLPSFQSNQITSLSQVEYTRFYTDAFLRASPIYLERYANFARSTLEIHDAYFDWRFLPQMFDDVLVLKSESDESKWGFDLSADPGVLCKNPQAKKAIWRLWSLRSAIRDYYENFRGRISEFLPVMRMQLEALK